MLAYGIALARLAGRASHFDVVHSHIDWVHIPLLRHLGVPFVTTLHGRLDLPDLNGSFESCSVLAVVFLLYKKRAAIVGSPWLIWARQICR
jgi:hypothetical protein